MFDAEARERRRQEIGNEIRQRQAISGHDGPLPSFLDFLTDKIIDFEFELKLLREMIAERTASPPIYKGPLD